MKPEPLFKVGEKVNIKSSNELGVIKGSGDAIDIVINDIIACIEYVYDGYLHNTVNISFYLKGHKYYRNYISILNFKEYEERADKQSRSAGNTSVWESALKDMEFNMQEEGDTIANWHRYLEDYGFSGKFTKALKGVNGGVLKADEDGYEKSHGNPFPLNAIDNRINELKQLKHEIPEEDCKKLLSSKGVEDGVRVYGVRVYSRKEIECGADTDYDYEEIPSTKITIKKSNINLKFE